MISRLSDQNLVARKQSSEDRRIIEVSTTPQGLSKIHEIETFNYNTILTNIDTLGEKEVQVLMNSIENLDILLGLRE